MTTQCLIWMIFSNFPSPRLCRPRFPHSLSPASATWIDIETKRLPKRVISVLNIYAMQNGQQGDKNQVSQRCKGPQGHKSQYLQKLSPGANTIFQLTYFDISRPLECRICLAREQRVISRVQQKCEVCRDEDQGDRCFKCIMKLRSLSLKLAYETHANFANTDLGFEALE